MSTLTLAAPQMARDWNIKTTLERAEALVREVAGHIQEQWPV